MLKYADIVAPLFVTLCICLFVVEIFKNWRIGLALPEHLRRLQSTHCLPTPRLGGLGIIAGYMTVFAMVGSDAALVGVSLLPVFLVGLLEDLDISVSAKKRLIVVLIACLIEVTLTNRWLVRYDVPGLDALAATLPFGVLLTLAVVGGLSHAFNLVDGLHGLSSGIGILASATLGLIATSAGDFDLARACYMFSAVLFGFWLVNFPFGQLFLGDSGAYLTGYILAWLGIALILRNPQVSAASVLLVFLWPLTETAWSIQRRRMTGRNPMQADRMHMHHLIMRGLEISVFGRGRRGLVNPIASAVLLPIAAMPMVAGGLLWRDALGGYIAVCAFMAGYVMLYLALVKLAHVLRRQGRPSLRTEVGS